jgi:peptidoglycan/xylan/chitin deacetylase (PgdA/CDA1 family)
MNPQSAILTYHSLDTSGSVISVPPNLFRRQIECLLDQGVPIVSLSEAFERPGSVALTFDDGFESLIEHALPILQEYKLPATVFVVTGYCGRLNTWPGQPKSGIPTLRLMSWSQLRELPDQVELGAHTVNHPDLSKLPREFVASELKDCRTALEDGTGRPVRSFAYPYGASTPAVRKMVHQEFTIACGTSLKFLRPDADPINLPRIDAYYIRQGLGAERLMALFGTVYIGVRNVLRTARSRVTGITERTCT